MEQGHDLHLLAQDHAADKMDGLGPEIKHERSRNLIMDGVVARHSDTGGVWASGVLACA